MSAPELIIDESPETVGELKALIRDLPDDMCVSDFSGELVNLRVYQCNGERYVEIM